MQKAQAFPIGKKEGKGRYGIRHIAAAHVFPVVHGEAETG